MQFYFWDYIAMYVVKNKNGKLAHTFNSSFRYIDDVLSLNNSRFSDYLHCIYPNELKVKDTTDTPKSTSYPSNWV